MSFVIHNFAEGLQIVADPSGLRMISGTSTIDWIRPEAWPSSARTTAAGRVASFDTSLLLQDGFGEIVADDVVIPYENFAEMLEKQYTLPLLFTEPSPFLLQIDRAGDLGTPGFRYKYRFLLGGSPVLVDRRGYYLKRSADATAYHLDVNHFLLLQAMDDFNQLPPEEKKPHVSWLTFADVKRLSNEVNAGLESWLRNNDVVVPSSIGLELLEENGALSFIPTCPELDDDTFRTVFERNASAQPLYSADRPGLGRLRIVLPENHVRVLERMKRVRKVSGEAKKELREDPLQVFDGIAGDLEWPPHYGERVTRIGLMDEVDLSPIPKAAKDEPGLSALWGEASPDSEGECSSILEDQPERPEKKTLIIETHEDTVGALYLDRLGHAGSTVVGGIYVAPQALSPSTQLFKHQQDGVAWLQRCAGIDGRTGVLLADDMGLGKTLQLLTFLAWCIESGKFPELSGTEPPFRPILIVAPLILLENGTWEEEIQRRFSSKGNVFWPVLSLYGPTLRAFRRRGLSGSEALLGEPALDLDRIRQHRVVITNYEALRDYEFSFAFHPGGAPLWSVVVADEAQECKTPNSRTSLAFKKLQPKFRIACTGTPVENRLLDLWNLFDALQPGLLGSARDFARDVEAPAIGGSSLANLRTTLQYQRPNAYLLRRAKAEVLTLPPKFEEELRVAMSPEEIVAHRRLAAGMDRTDKPLKKVDLLHQFARLSQHPLLLGNSGDGFSVEELKRSSSKLRAVLEVLQRVKASGEKALVFARHLDVQRMLARVLSAEFQSPVRVVNGETPRSPGLRDTAVRSRKQIIEHFSKTPGFQVLILSPFVAGVGLTITEANHVIHYGRWWNPAVESQATDRVYRIGQERPVHVHLPILYDPSGQVSVSFDELLNRLLQGKKTLSNRMLEKDAFLTPQESESSSAVALFDELAATGSKAAT
jgi:SNF2 family DNA or RNA helicase